MKAMDIMEALGGVPRDLIKDCFRPSAEAAGRGAEQMPFVRSVSAEQPYKGSIVPRWITAAALAACTVFAVGVFLIHGSRSHEVLQSTEDSAAVPAETEIMQTEPAATVTEPAETTAAPVVYAELELHEQEKRIYTWEESDAVLQAARERYRKNGGPLLIDTQKYIQKYFSEDSGADINDWEAKSYIYHMMLNSIDYYSAAEGQMIYGKPNNHITIFFQSDDKARKSYEREESAEATCEVYFSGFDDPFSSFLTNVNLTDKTYTQSYCTVDDQNDFIMSDNDRRTYQPDGTGLAFNRMDGMNLGISSSCCLFPQDIAMSRLDDFDCWRITGAENVLGRTSAQIEGTHADRTIRLLVDVTTGILMKYEEMYANGTQRDSCEVTALTVDEQVSVKEFDPSGLTEKEQLRPQISETE